MSGKVMKALVAEGALIDLMGAYLDPKRVSTDLNLNESDSLVDDRAECFDHL